MRARFVLQESTELDFDGDGKRGTSDETETLCVVIVMEEERFGRYRRMGKGTVKRAVPSTHAFIN